MEEPASSRRAAPLSRATHAVLHASMITLGIIFVFDVITQPGWVTEDFRSFYLAGWAARLDLPIYDPNTLRELGAILGLDLPIHPYLYPPPLAYAATAGLTAVGLWRGAPWSGRAAAAWALACDAGALAFLFMTGRAGLWPPMPLPIFLAAIVFFLCLPWLLVLYVSRRLRTWMLDGA